jgi:8-oxo-dGTP diphosphatase
MMETIQALDGNTIYLTFNPEEFQSPGHVLILPFYKGQLVFMRHVRRGIELPGGKMEANETPLAAAVREAYEEIGASLSEIKLIGQYIVHYPHHVMVKSIYTAVVAELLPIPYPTDSLGPITFPTLPVDIKDHPDFSPYMKDEVYPRTLRYLGLI